MEVARTRSLAVSQAAVCDTGAQIYLSVSRLVSGTFRSVHHKQASKQAMLKTDLVSSWS